VPAAFVLRALEEFKIDPVHPCADCQRSGHRLKVLLRAEQLDQETRRSFFGDETGIYTLSILTRNNISLAYERAITPFARCPEPLGSEMADCNAARTCGPGSQRTPGEAARELRQQSRGG
jgi:hypothetical protein